MAWLDDQEFYEMCQSYRHADDVLPGHPALPTAAEAFERLKDYIRERAAPPARQDAVQPGDLEPHVHGLEFAIQLLRDIKRIHPEVLRDTDIDAAIMNELNPALVSARAAVRARQAVLNARQEAGQPVAGMAQGQCETTSTPRFWIPNCECGTYENNLGPCMTWEEGGAIGRCVYCDHDLTCHRKLSAIYAAPPAGRPSEQDRLDAEPDRWMCGCGWINGVNLANCAACNRTVLGGSGRLIDAARKQEGNNG